MLSNLSLFYARQQNATHVLAMAWASARPSVRHTLQPYQNGARYDHKIFTVAAMGPQ